jgi:Arc/MetJ-type ribon-helix-helix transcriptional regulator
MIEMETIQIRLTRNMLEQLDVLIKDGKYPNRSEAVRDGVRRLIEYRPPSNKVLNVSVKDLQKFIRDTDKK